MLNLQVFFLVVQVIPILVFRLIFSISLLLVAVNFGHFFFWFDFLLVNLGYTLRDVLIFVELCGKFLHIIIIRIRWHPSIDFGLLIFEFRIWAVFGWFLSVSVTDNDKNVLIAEDRELHCLLDNAPFSLGAGYFPFVMTFDHFHSVISFLHH